MKIPVICLPQLTHAMLFLFPIGLTTIRHWSSGFFALLCLLGLFSLRKNIASIKLEPEEKIVVSLVALLFFSFLLSFRANGWESTHVHFIEDEINFLFFVPLYFLLKQAGNTIKPLLQGSILGIFVTFAFSVYDVYVLDMNRASGAYSPLLLGPVTCAMVFFVLNGYQVLGNSTLWRYLSFICVPLGIFVVYLSISRSAYILTVALSVITVLIQFPGEKIKTGTSIVLLVVAFLLSYQYAPKINKGINNAIAALSQFIETNDITSLDMGKPGSSGKHRLVMLHAAYAVFSDNLLFGVGRGGYSDAVREYVDTKQINPAVANHSHPHNIFTESMISKGIIGLSLLSLLFLYLFYRLFLYFKSGIYVANTAIVVVVSLFVWGLFEASPIIRGNFIAFGLIYLASVLCETVKEREN